MKNSYIAEFIGTFTLATLVALSITGAFTLSTPVLAALVLSIFVYTIGHISGTHINPAVTVGAWFNKKIGQNDAIYYVLAQLLAGVVAYFVIQWLRPGFGIMNAGWWDAVGEIAGAAVFTFGIAAATSGKVDKNSAGFIIGGSLLLGIALSSLLGAAGVLNPAVAIALGLYMNPVYLLAPIVGSIVGFFVYEYIAK